MIEFNWDKTENLLGVSDLAMISVFVLSTGVLGRWYCPPEHSDQVVAKVAKLCSKYSAQNCKITVLASKGGQ